MIPPPPLTPAKAGAQLQDIEPHVHQHRRRWNWVPAFAGMSGVVGVAVVSAACTPTFQRSADCDSAQPLLAGFRDYVVKNDLAALARALPRGADLAEVRSQLQEAGFANEVIQDRERGSLLYAGREMTCGNLSSADRYVLSIEHDNARIGAAEAAVFGEASYVPSTTVRPSRPLGNR